MFERILVISLPKNFVSAPQSDIVLEALTLATTSTIVVTMKMATTRNAISKPQHRPFLWLLPDWPCRWIGAIYGTVANLGLGPFGKGGKYAGGGEPSFCVC